MDILLYFKQNTIEGYIAFFPAVGRLKCESSSIDHQGFWQMDGFGLLSVYKSDWLRFEGIPFSTCLILIITGLPMANQSENG